MRKILMLAVLMTACCWGVKAGEDAETGDAAATEIAGMVRIPILHGIYTVEAPEEWHLEVSGVDFTATFSEGAMPMGPDGTLVITPPNPVVDDVKLYTKLSVQGIMNYFEDGEVVEEDDKNIGKFPSFAATFKFKAEDTPYMGWSRTIEMDGYAVQMITLAAEAKFASFMETALAIADSYVLDVDEADAFAPELKRLGRRIYDEVEKGARLRDDKENKGDDAKSEE